jgi:hypothetical protein
MAYVDQFASSTYPIFVQQVTVAMTSAAIAIASEAAATANHNNRVTLAKLVAANPTYWGPLFALGVSVNLAVNSVTVATLPTDANVQNSVNAIWNTFAGVL